MVEVKNETAYEVLCNIDLKGLVCKGILSSHLLDWKIIYERYLKELDNGTVGTAKQFVADEYNISYRTVSRIVGFMNG